MKSEFSRINLLPNYVFAEINQLKAKLRKKGNDIIDFGMGNPDMPTPEHIRNKLKEAKNQNAPFNPSSYVSHTPVCILNQPNH